MEIDYIFLAESSTAGVHNAYKLVEWLRFAKSRLQPQDITRLVTVVERFHPTTLKNLFKNLHPTNSLMSKSGNLKTASRQLLQVYVTCLPLIPVSL
jgi:hypothetical protein